MRLDLFLKTSRLVVRRSIAQELCDAGVVSVNDSPAKSSKEVKAGDVIEIKKRNRITKVEILDIPDKKQVSKDGAAGLYRLIAETEIERDEF